MKTFNNIYYFPYVNKIGGAETFLFELVKKYNKEFDTVIIYKSGDPIQLKRLRKYARTYLWDGKEPFSCNKIFCNFTTDILDYCDAKEYNLIVHGDYKALGVSPPSHPKLNNYICVSKTVEKSMHELGYKNTILCYNPINIEEIKRPLNLISATRLTHEKGKDRIKKLADILTKNNIPFIWQIFTDDVNAIDNPNVVYVKPRLDIRNFIANADYLVQLSSTESFCYSMVEALMLKTPVIVTDFPAAKEFGVIDGENGYILDFDLSNIDVDNIYNNIPIIKESITHNDSWNKVLYEGKSDYVNKHYEVEALDTYTKNNIVDNELQRIPKGGERFIVDQYRLNTLLGNNPSGMIFVKVIKELE